MHFDHLHFLHETKKAWQSPFFLFGTRSHFKTAREWHPRAGHCPIKRTIWLNKSVSNKNITLFITSKVTSLYFQSRLVSQFEFRRREQVISSVVDVLAVISSVDSSLIVLTSQCWLPWNLRFLVREAAFFREHPIIYIYKWIKQNN